MIWTILNWSDAALVLLIVLAAVDALRRVQFFSYPVLALGLYIVAIGAFGIFSERLRGYWISPWSVMLHVGFVMYAWEQRARIVDLMAQWDGVERRKGRRT